MAQQWQYCRKTSYMYTVGLYVSKLIYHHEGEEKVLLHKCCVSFTFIYIVCRAQLRLKRRQCSSAMYPKASHRAALPARNRCLTPSLLSLVSVFCPLKKSSQHAHKIHKKNLEPSKSCRASVSKLFQILRCGFSENWGKEIGFNAWIHEESPTQTQRIRPTFLWHDWGSPHSPRRKHNDVPD